MFEFVAGLGEFFRHGLGTAEQGFIREVAEYEMEHFLRYWHWFGAVECFADGVGEVFVPQGVWYNDIDRTGEFFVI